MTGLPSLRASVVVALVIVALMIALRAALPSLVTSYLTGVLEDMPGHTGAIEDVDIHLWRGAYSIHRLRIDAVGKDKPTPLFNAQEIRLSVEWGALLRGRLVGQVDFIKPRLNIVTEPEDIKEEKLRLEEMVDRFHEFLPLRIDRFTAVDGELRFQDITARPPIEIYIDQIQLVAQNLTNSASVAEDLWATVSATGRAMGSGRVRLEMRFNPNEKWPTYQLAFELNDLRLTAINDYLRHYLAVQARDGTLSLYAESTARGGRFKGYVKPVVKDLDIIEVKPKSANAAEAVKGFFVKLMARIFENEPKEQIATVIEFSGSFDDPEISLWEAVITFIRNAFVQALRPGLDASVAPREAEKAKSAPPPDRRGPRAEREPPASQ